ncbi:MAG TPA: 30S ribosomal protein S3 [Dehalococcoidia bacterium]|nr:30S ribosomal protein S3 [Dehalococcoidia bacterium]
MGQKVHPHGFRLGVIYDWESKWFAERDYKDRLRADIELRALILDLLPDAGISRIEIDRNANLVTVTVHTAKPGIVIGRGGARVEELRGSLEELTGGRIRVNIQEIRTPELDAFLVARAVADQLERRVAFRRAVKQAVQRTMQRGAQGVRISVAGRLGGTEMSRRETETAGRVPRHTLRADIDYGLAEAHTTFGRIGVKAWIYKGDILPDEVEEEVEEPLILEEEALDLEQSEVEEVVEPEVVEPEDRGPQHMAISVEQQEAVARQTQEDD